MTTDNILSETVPEFNDRNKQRPHDVKTVVEYEQDQSDSANQTLVITVSLQLSDTGKNEKKSTIGTSLITVLFMSLLMVGCIDGMVRLPMLFFDVFDIWTALKYTALCSCGVLLASSVILLLSYISFIQPPFYRWTLRINKDKITLDRWNGLKNFRRQVRRDEIISVENGPAESIKNYFNKERQTLQYWLYADLVWSKKHIRLNTSQNILAIPCRNEEEQKWLLRIIQDYLNNKPTS